MNITYKRINVRQSKVWNENALYYFREGHQNFCETPKFSKDSKNTTFPKEHFRAM
jgi:hypothetical protein